MEEYTRTDLACESCTEGIAAEIRSREDEADGFRLTRLTIPRGEWEKRIGKPAGNYITVMCGKIWELEEDAANRLIAVLAREIAALAERMTGKSAEEKKHLRVLMIGLGNPDITPDAVGPETVRRITVTRPFSAYDRSLFESLECAEVSAFAPGVFGQTGLESVDLVGGAVKQTDPDLIVAIDALAARSCERLAATVQLSDCGISPGSGIGNCRRAIDRRATGAPVLSVGVPTVVDSATLVYDALEQAGIREPDASLKQVLENGRRFYVSPKESDRITGCVSKVLASALNEAFGTGNIGGYYGI